MTEPTIWGDYVDEMMDENSRLKERIKELESTLNMFADPDNWTYRNLFMIWKPDADPVVLAHRILKRKDTYETSN